MTLDPTVAPKPISGSDGERTERDEPHWFRQQWADNHGNFLIAFVIGTVLVNAGYVAYQQSKFVPLKFPDERAFRELNAEVDAAVLPIAKSVNFRVIGAPTLAGSIVIAVYESAATLGNPELAVETWNVPLEDGVAFLSVAPDELPAAFSVIAFHDGNKDGRLTQHAKGIPLERYGYSGTHRYLSPGEPPSFEQTVIERPSPGSEVEIFIR